LVELITYGLFHDGDYFQQQRWPIPIALLLSALIVRLLLKPRKRQPPRGIRSNNRGYISCSSDFNVSLEPERSQLPFLHFFREQDTYFGIPVRFWPWILIVLASAACACPLKNL
jgi:hypothetical protein